MSSYVHCHVCNARIPQQHAVKRRALLGQAITDGQELGVQFGKISAVSREDITSHYGLVDFCRKCDEEEEARLARAHALRGNDWKKHFILTVFFILGVIMTALLVAAILMIAAAILK